MKSNHLHKIILKTATVLLAVLLLFSTCLLSGCAEESFTLYFGIDKMPKNIDPQKASSYSEILAVRNCFKGLFTLDENGNAKKALAEDYTISDDGLVYTFKVKNDTIWSNNKPVTAYDFEFGIKRAALAETDSPHTELLENIKGAKELISGNDAELYVYANDSHTLTITLTKPDQNFLLKLTNTVFMPCNEEFFNKCSGKYGLSASNILTNGDYRIKSWVEGSFVRLMKNNLDGDYFEAESVYLSVSSKGKDTVTRINDKEIGMTVNYSDDYKTVNTEKYTVLSEYRNNYAIVINKSSAIGKNEKLTEALNLAIHREYYVSRLNERFTVANSVIPKNAILFGKRFSNYGTAEEYSKNYSSVDARELFLAGVKELSGKKFPKTEIITFDNAEIKSILSDVILKWQQDLGAYVNVKTVSSEEALMSRVNAGDFTIAFVPLPSDVSEILGLFSENHGVDIKSTEYNKLINEINSTDDIKVAAENAVKATEILANEPCVIPIFSKPTSIIYDKEYQNVNYHKADMTVEFASIYKK